MDAQNVNVYQGCSACLFILDPRNVVLVCVFYIQLDSIEYFKQNITDVPIHIPVLVIANFRDQFSDWKVTSSDLEKLINEYTQSPLSPDGEAVPSSASGDVLLSSPKEFGTMVGEVYKGRRRVIKLIETSFLEKFGLHVISNRRINRSLSIFFYVNHSLCYS